MNDRKLLELAAKAAGLDFDPTVKNKHGLLVADRNGCQSETRVWNPLTDDGDALRLAVKLRMPLWFDEAATIANQRQCGDSGWRVETGIDDLGGYAATRRAIVRAAAKIGKATA